MIWQVDPGDGEGTATAGYPFAEVRPFEVRLAGGQASPLWVNRPRVDWVEHQQVYSGQRLRLFGRNLHCVAEVTLVGSRGNPIPLIPVRSAAYVWETRVATCPTGNYALQLDGQPVGELEVVARDEDPLDLQVAWTNRFRWQKVTAVAPPAMPSTTADHTVTLQKALDEAAAQGGGVVRLPAGEFRVRSLRLPPGVVLWALASERPCCVIWVASLSRRRTWDRTIPRRGMQAAHAIIHATAGPVGVARLSLVSDVMHPNDGLRRIDGYVIAVKMDGRGSRDVFVSDVLVRLASGSGVHLSADRNMLIQRCDIRVPCWAVNMHSGDAWAGGALRDCTLTNQQRPLVCFGCPASVFEGNHLIGDNRTLDWGGPLAEHRISDHGSRHPLRQYIADNRAEGMFGSHKLNDGEGICFQGAQRLAYGDLAAAGVDWLSDEGRSFKAGVLEGAWVVIVRGRGAGQLRRVTANTEHHLSVQPAWDIVPTAGDAYTVDRMIGAYQTIIVNNSIAGVKKCGIDLYCKNYDNWIQGNSLVNAGGIFLNATEVRAQQRLDMSYFNVVRDNVVTGTALDPETRRLQDPRMSTDHGLTWGITIGHVNPVSSFPDVRPSLAVYGNEVRHNTVRGPMANASLRGATVPAAAVILGMRTAKTGTTARGNLVEDNEVRDLPVGIRLGEGTADTWLRNNRFFPGGQPGRDVEVGVSESARLRNRRKCHKGPKSVNSQQRAPCPAGVPTDPDVISHPVPRRAGLRSEGTEKGGLCQEA